MINTLVQDLIEAGIHFGQRAAAWNPKMGRYIYGKRNGIHIIDIKETVKGLLLAKKFVAKVVADGKDVCFVGTKRQARNVLETRVPDVKMHWVTDRWLGGTLTNFRTIRLRLKRLIELEEIEKADNFASYSKKMESQLRREMAKIKRNLDGIRHMEKLPGVMVVIDVKHEATALREARKLGIPTICLIDTDGDPDLVDIPIPGNDDSMRSIDVVVRELCSAAREGRQARSGSELVTTSRRGRAESRDHAPPLSHAELRAALSSSLEVRGSSHRSMIAAGFVCLDAQQRGLQLLAGAPSPVTFGLLRRNSVRIDEPVFADLVITDCFSCTVQRDEFAPMATIEEEQIVKLKLRAGEELDYLQLWIVPSPETDRIAFTVHFFTRYFPLGKLACEAPVLKGGGGATRRSPRSKSPAGSTPMAVFA